MILSFVGQGSGPPMVPLRFRYRPVLRRAARAAAAGRFALHLWSPRFLGSPRAAWRRARLGILLLMILPDFLGQRTRRASMRDAMLVLPPSAIHVDAGHLRRGDSSAYSAVRRCIFAAGWPRYAITLSARAAVHRVRRDGDGANKIEPAQRYRDRPDGAVQ